MKPRGGGGGPPPKIKLNKKKTQAAGQAGVGGGGPCDTPQKNFLKKNLKTPPGAPGGAPAAIFYGKEIRRLPEGSRRYFPKKLCNLFCRNKPKRETMQVTPAKLPYGTPSDCLVLLYPYPDTVRSFRLHKTLRSTPLAERSPSICCVERDIQSCCSGLQVQGTANSPLSTAI